MSGNYSDFDSPDSDSDEFHDAPCVPVCASQEYEHTPVNEGDCHPVMGDSEKSQLQPIDPTQVKNSAGGYTWKVDDKCRLRRFLCLGSEGGTYYIKEKELGIENAKCIFRLIETGKGEEMLAEVVKFSVEGRAAKQNPVIFALAVCARQEIDSKLKKLAYERLSQVCRIPTHLFAFIEYCEKLSRGTGWGRSHRKGVCLWYLQFKDNPQQLAMHVTKYRSRNGWSHKDVLRLAHPKANSEGVDCLLRYIVKGLNVAKQDFFNDDTPESLRKVLQFLEAVEDVKVDKTVAEVVAMIQKHGLVREHIPTSLLSERLIWLELLQKMPMTAMIRNLGKMTNIQLLHPELGDAKACDMVTTRLQDDSMLKKAKIHPFNVLTALYTYQKGSGELGSLKWEPNKVIVKALNEAFYKSFKFVEATNQRYLLAVDVSGSMAVKINGSSMISCMDAAAALAMVTMRTENSHKIMAFSHTLRDIDITSSMSLEVVLRTMKRIQMGATDCSLPMIEAMRTQMEVDVFIIFTDSETYIGRRHPADALREYRKKSGIWNAKLIVCAMASNGFTIADPEDPGMLDMAGFDSSGPEIIRNFSLGLL